MMVNSEIQQYLIKAENALQQSHDVFNLGHYDLAVSRAYYAMFYAAYALLSSKGLATKKHSALRSLFAQHFVKPGLIEPEYSRMLSNAFNLRLDSDYNVTATPEKGLAQDVLNDSMKFMDRVEQYLENYEQA